MHLTFLGTGAAGGVPLWGCECKVCSLARIDVSYVRRPNSAVIEAGAVRLLLDAGVTDLAERFQPGELSAILVMHFHADHVQGLFHLRWGKGALDVYAPYDAEGCADLYKYPGPFRFKHIFRFDMFNVGDVRIMPVPLVHTKPTLGYCIEHNGERLAYLSDCRELPPATTEFLTEWQPHTICVDCTYPPGTPEPRNHFNLPEAHALCQSYPASQIVLMRVGHQLDEQLLKRQSTLPDRVMVARDGETLVCMGNP